MNKSVVKSVAISTILILSALMICCYSVAAYSEPLLAGAYRLDVNGWIFVHVEGKPFQMGYQRGYLAAPEIVHSLEAYTYIAENWGYPWEFYRACALKMYWVKMPPEFKEEIMGMAAGVRARGYKIDWLDIVAANGRYDTEYYWDYLVYNKLPIPEHLGSFPKTGALYPRLDDEREGCSAFIATGDATETGEIIIGHNTWTSYVVAGGSGYNMILHMKPERGYEILMQPQVFAIYSGRDWHINGAGLMICETTIPGMIKYFNPEGIPYFVRVRYATQYASTIDEWMKLMLYKNNGAYSNDYLIGDAKTGEICEFELGCYHWTITRTFNGFIGSSNYPVSPGIRSETTYDYTDPTTSGYCRYQRWQQIIKEYYGEVTVDLAKQFLADHYDVLTGKWAPSRRTLCGHGEAVGVPSGAVDGKVTCTSLALQMRTWAHWGHPCCTDFYAKPFLALYPRYSWQAPYLVDILSWPWTLFSA